MEFLICSSRLLTSSGFSAVFPAAPYQRYSSSILCLTELIRCEISVIMDIYRGQDLDISMTSRVYCHITEILASPTYLGDYWSSQRDTRLLPILLFVCLFVWPNSPQWAMASSFTKFLDHTQRHTTVGRTPLDEWSARRIDLYLTTHNTWNRQSSMSPVGFEQQATDRRPTP